MTSKADRIKELTEILNRASKAYYMQDTEIMSNYEYEALYDELVQLEKETGITLSNSPTIHVGYDKGCSDFVGLAGRSDGRSFLEDGRPDDCINL